GRRRISSAELNFWCRVTRSLPAVVPYEIKIGEDRTACQMHPTLKNTVCFQLTLPLARTCCSCRRSLGRKECHACSAMNWIYWLTTTIPFLSTTSLDRKFPSQFSCPTVRHAT